jgi:hypothetical protein
MSESVYASLKLEAYEFHKSILQSNDWGAQMREILNSAVVKVECQNEFL